MLLIGDLIGGLIHGIHTHQHVRRVETLFYHLQSGGGWLLLLHVMTACIRRCGDCGYKQLDAV